MAIVESADAVAHADLVDLHVRDEKNRRNLNDQLLNNLSIFLKFLFMVIVDHPISPFFHHRIVHAHVLDVYVTLRSMASE